MSARVIYLAVFVFYIMAVLLFAWIKRSTCDSDSFWTENRSVSGFRAGISLSATFMSISWSVVYGIEVFLRYGIGGFFVLSLPWILVLGIFIVLAPRLRNIPVFSQPELIGGRFGRTAGRLTAIPILAVFIIWAGAELDVASALLGGATGIHPVAILLTVALTIGTYMTISGTRAVIITDVIQYVLVAFFFLLIITAGHTGAQVNTTVLELDGDRIHPLFIFITFIAYLPGWLSETDIWIRLQITKNGREARKAMLLAWINGVVFVFLMPLLAALFVPDSIQNGTHAVTALMGMLKNPLAIGIAAIGLVAASMSTIDTCINVSAMTLAYDLPEKRSQQGNRVAVWVTTGAAVLFALYSDTLKDAFYLSSGLLSTTLFLPVVACYVPWGRRRGVMAVLIGAPVLTVLTYALENRGWISIPGSEGVSYILLSFLFACMLFAGFSIQEWTEGKREDQPE